MKITKKFAVLLVISIMVFCAIMFSACTDNSDNGSENGIEVTKEEWTEKLAVNLEACDNITVRLLHYYEEQAEHLVGDYSIIMQYDFNKQILFKSEYHEFHQPDTPDTVSRYYFHYDDDCYGWEESYGIVQILSYDFELIVSQVYRSVSDLAYYSDEKYYESASFNTQKGIYEIDPEIEKSDFAVSIQFFKNGNVKLIMQLNYEIFELYVENINSTDVVLPNNAQADLEAYLAKNAQ